MHHPAKGLPHAPPEVPPDDRRMKTPPTRGLPRLSWLLGILVALALTGGCSEVRDAINGDESTPTSEATDAASTASEAQLSATPGLVTNYIGNTGGLGISLRSDCTTEARIEGAWAETTEVRILERGTDRCEGWSRASANGVTTWVAQSYLVSSAPAATVGLAAPAPPTSSTPTETPEPTPSPTPTVAPTTTPSNPSGAPVPPMVLYGPIASGDSVLILVDRQPCKTATAIADVTSPTGHLWLVQIEQNECGAQAGSTLSFALNGASTNEQLEWSPGAVPPNIATGLTLTLR
jgi:hypothetical protein